MTVACKESQVPLRVESRSSRECACVEMYLGQIMGERKRKGISTIVCFRFVEAVMMPLSIAMRNTQRLLRRIGVALRV